MLLEAFAATPVLIVDDNAANVALLKAVLGRAGLARVEAVSDSREAMASYDRVQPNLVLLDLHMPGVDGYELLSQLSERAGAKYLPILVLTADTTRDAMHRALSLGARDFLTKPLDVLEVTLRVRNLLETRELYDRLRHHNLALKMELADYQSSQEIETHTRDAQRERVQNVLDSGTLKLVYQPIVELGALRTVGYEALSRFPLEPVQGPDRWFADARDIGLGVELELLAVKQAVAAQASVPESAMLAVNLSPASVMSSALRPLLADADLTRLVIEVTEHVEVENFATLHKALAPLRAAGARLAVDDTGAGYAGFRHLLGLEPDIVKLDITLTRGIDTDPARRALAAALVSFSVETNAPLIAEGVETDAELSTVRDLGIDWAQGYYLGRPSALPTHVQAARDTPSVAQLIANQP